MTPKANIYFSGGGLSCVGMKLAGIDVQQSLDIDPEATDVMRLNKHYHSQQILTEDITTKLVKGQPDCDVMGFTYPCTKYSLIGEIHQVRTGDELYLHALRHLAVSGVELFWAENVPGMKKFKVVMETMTQLAGYYITVFCPVKAGFWLPQQRNRLIIIGSKKPFFITPPNYINNRPRLKDMLESDPVVDMPDYVLSRINGNYRDKPIIVDPDQPGAIAPCCVAHYSKDLGTRLVKDKKARHGVRPFTIREYARLQGVPDDYIFPDKRSSYKIIGNGVPVPMAKWVGKQIMNYFN
jgi:DNA (cytosine-5)-methyltransferase 1